ncbi:RNase H domain-containing protein [Trichonephila clavipes]|nr:RNase H domain-containing protein [Trichonephila clavipes]
MRKHSFIDFNVDTSTPFNCITPIDSFNHVELREELLTSTPKHSSHLELLRQLSLEVINDIPDQALIIYTDGSRSDTGRAGNGIFSNIPGNDVKISIRNPADHCSVFRSELIAIIGALDHALNSYKDSIWILTDSRRSCDVPLLGNTSLEVSAFVEWAQNEIAVVPDFHKRILFSDEAHFWLNGYVNKQNCRIWSEANPQVYVETPLHPEKLTVWCALWAGGILLQKR